MPTPLRIRGKYLCFNSLQGSRPKPSLASRPWQLAKGSAVDIPVRGTGVPRVGRGQDPALGEPKDGRARTGTKSYLIG